MWLNTVDYTNLQLALCLIGSVLWVLVYVEIIRNVHRNHFLEMPLIVVAGNFAWEGLYSWFYSDYINLGDLLLWGYRAWFLLDIYIVFLALRYGCSQFENAYIRKNIKPFFFSLLAAYLLLNWACIESGLDNMPIGGDGHVKLGGISAYVLNIIISLGYLHLYLTHRSGKGFTMSTAWMKGVGTLCFSIFFAMTDSHNYMLLAMAAIVFVLDAAYIIIRWKYPSITNVSSLSGTPRYVVNPAFERLWEEHPEARSTYERQGLKLRQLTFDRWKSITGDYESYYWVLEGNIIRQVSKGTSVGAAIRGTTMCLRNIINELDLNFKSSYLMTDALNTSGGDLESRNLTVAMFSEPEHANLGMYLIAGRFVRAAMNITFPVNPDVMNKWKLFGNEDAAFIAVIQNFLPGKGRSTIAIDDKLKVEPVTNIRLRQVYGVLSKIADDDVDTVESTTVPEDDPFCEVFDALNQVLMMKRQQMRDIKRINNELIEQNLLIEAERQLSESLLLNVLPASIAQRLKNGERSIADYHASVSILFADIVDFTPLAARHQPREVVGWLNDLYSRFDRIAHDLGIERIKTIGDAYMAVAGAPDICPDHPFRITRFALAMLHEAEMFSTSIGEQIVLRIGISCGEVVGAVVGETKFAYDFWGDAVNTAARMESNGVAGKIHVSEEFIKILAKDNAVGDAADQHLEVTERGEMEIKGKGVMRTYFLSSDEHLN